MARRPPSDVPSMEPRTRRGDVIAFDGTNIYTINVGNTTHLAVYDGTNVLPLDTSVDIVFHPESDQWRIANRGAADLTEYLIFAGVDHGYDAQYMVASITPNGVGAPIDGPERLNNNGDYPNRCAVSADGSYVVAITNINTVGLFLRNGNTYNVAPLDTITISGEEFLSIAISVNGDVLIGGVLTPFLYAYPSSSGGFGSAYSDPADPAGFNVTDIEWHPTGQAFLAAADGTVSPQAWAFVPGVGFGSAYPDQPLDTNWQSSFAVADRVDFSFDGNYALIISDAAGEGTNAEYRFAVFNFTLASGFGSRLSNPPAVPIGGGSAYGVGKHAITNSNIYVVMAKTPSNLEYHLVKFPYTSAGIGAGISLGTPAIPTSTTSNAKQVRISRSGRLLAWWDNTSWPMIQFWDLVTEKFIGSLLQGEGSDGIAFDWIS